MTTFLDLFGIACLIAFAAIIWPPLILPAAAIAALFTSWRLSR